MPRLSEQRRCGAVAEPGSGALQRTERLLLGVGLDVVDDVTDRCFLLGLFGLVGPASEALFEIVGV